MPKISSKLKTLFYLTFFIFLAHTIEEYFTLYVSNTTVQYASSLDLSNQNKFVVIEILVILLFLGAIYMIRRNRMPFFFMLIFGLFYIFQLEHITGAINFRAYYPGLATGLLINGIGIFYWLELVKSRTPAKH